MISKSCHYPKIQLFVIFLFLLTHLLFTIPKAKITSELQKPILNRTEIYFHSSETPSSSPNFLSFLSLLKTLTLYFSQWLLLAPNLLPYPFRTRFPFLAKKLNCQKIVSFNFSWKNVVVRKQILSLSLMMLLF